MITSSKGRRERRKVQADGLIFVRKRADIFPLFVMFRANRPESLGKTMSIFHRLAIEFNISWNYQICKEYVFILIAFPPGPLDLTIVIALAFPDR